MAQDRLDDLTGARFFAALGVVILHFAPLTPLLFNPTAYRWVPYGKTCVSFFFILSGFVLAYTYLDWFRQGVTRDRCRRFLRNRLARILPAHAAVLLLMTPLVAAIRLGGPDTAGTVWTLTWTWLVNVLLVQIYVPSFEAASWWNVPAWSIDCEAFFYVAFPLLAWGIGRWLTTPARLLMAGLVAYGLETGAFVGTAWWITAYGPFGSWPNSFTLDFHSHLPHLRLWEFAIGCLAGAYVQRRHQAGTRDWLHRPWIRNALLTLSLAAVVAIMAWPGTSELDRISKATLGWYVLFTPAFTLIILALASGRTWLSGLLRHPWTVKLGEASYALYLVHWSAVLVDEQLKAGGLEAWRLGFGGNLILCLAAALALHRWVETPARQKLRAPTVDNPSHGAHHKHSSTLNY
jgi:peptidoglycan/LPS O-acetylase OafA/YrhL